MISIRFNSFHGTGAIPQFPGVRRLSPKNLFGHGHRFFLRFAGIAAGDAGRFTRRF
jgi:hypothetical protein